MSWITHVHDPVFAMFRFDFDLDDADDDDGQAHRTSLKPTAEHPGAADTKRDELAPFREIPLDQLVRFRFPYSSASMHFEDRVFFFSCS